MSGTEENTPVADGPATLADVAGKSSRISFRSVIYVLAAVAAAIFIFDWSPGRPYSMISHLFRHRTSFQSLLLIVSWLFAFGLMIVGLVRLGNAYPPRQPDFPARKYKALFRFYLAFGFFAFPFVQSWLSQSYLSSTYNTPAGDRDFLAFLTLLCWYFGALVFCWSDVALMHALRNKDNPSGVTLKEMTAAYLITGFVLFLAPCILMMVTGVQLW